MQIEILRCGVAHIAATHPPNIAESGATSSWVHQRNQEHRAGCRTLQFFHSFLSRGFRTRLRERLYPSLGATDVAKYVHTLWTLCMGSQRRGMHSCLLR